MEFKELPAKCGFCKKGNERCPIRNKEMDIRFPDHSYGIVIPNDEFEAMGKELIKNNNCFEPVYTDAKGKEEWKKKQS